jgi:hypothetical protein
MKQDPLIDKDITLTAFISPSAEYEALEISHP